MAGRRAGRRSHVVPSLTRATAAGGRSAPRRGRHPRVPVPSDEVDAAVARTNRILSEAEVSPNYQKLLDHGDAENVGDILAAGSESTIVQRLRRFADAGVTDISVRVVPIGDGREELIASSTAATRRAPGLVGVVAADRRAAPTGRPAPTKGARQWTRVTTCRRRAPCGGPSSATPTSTARRRTPTRTVRRIPGLHHVDGVGRVGPGGRTEHRRDRSLLVLVMTAALGRMEEFRLHARSAARAGVTDEELDELPFQIAAYCGAPAGIAARRALLAARAARDGEG